MDDEARLPDLEEMPGFAHLAESLQSLLVANERGNIAERQLMLHAVAQVVDVFASRALLEYAYLPLDDDAEAALEEDREPRMAWFDVQQTQVDPDRDAVTMLGDCIEVVEPPIVLEAADTEED